MRVTGIELHPVGSGTAQTLSFRNPGRAYAYNVKEVTGLDADAIVTKYYGSSGSGNDMFYNMMIEKRDVVMRVSLNPEWANSSYSELRDELYKIISSSRTGLVDIWFMNESGVVAVLSGWVTKFESPQFTKSPEVLITFKTKDPMLKALDPVDVSVVDLDMSDTNIQDRISSAPHGFDFTLKFTAAKPSLTIGDPDDSSWSFTVTPAGGFLNADELHFSSDPNDKKLYIVRGSPAVTIYIADKIAAGSVWPIIFPGDNHFSFSTPTDIHFMDISYFPTFWGV